MCVLPAIVALLQHTSFETEDELNENRFPSLPFVTSNYLSGEYETAIMYTVYSKKCDVFRIH